MDFNPDQFGISRKNLLSANVACDEAETVPLDWPGLVARLAAAHAARQVLAPLPRPRARPPGSFAPAVAHRIANILPNAGNRTDGFHHAALTQSLKPIASRHDR